MEKNGLFSQRIRLRHLHTFVAVAQQGTLGRAAETLNLSQPALSKTLNELEQLTGTRLFDRGRLGAQLTLVGEQFLTHAVKVLDALNTAGQALNRKEEPASDIVRVGALPTAALGILPAAIGQFHRQQKHATLQVATMNNTMLLAGLKSGELDLGIGRMSDPELMSGLNYELLFPGIAEAGRASESSPVAGHRDPEPCDGVAGGGLTKRNRSASECGSVAANAGLHAAFRVY